MARILALSLVAATALLSGGCAQQPPGTVPAGDSIALVPIAFAAWQEKLAGYAGDIVVVDMWATWCVPCIERFPHMVKLHGRYSPRGVRFISMSLDDREDTIALDRAREFLVQQKAVFDNYLMDEGITDAFEKLDLLSIPAVLIYGRDRSLRFKLTGDDPNNQFTGGDVEEAIEQLLQEEG